MLWLLGVLVIAVSTALYLGLYEENPASTLEVDDAIRSCMGGWLPREHPEWLTDEEE